MKKLLLSLTALLSAAVSYAQDRSATFDFTSQDQLTAWGLAIPAFGEGTSVNGVELQSDGVTFVAHDNSATTTTRVFSAATTSSTPGALNLRLYSGADFVITVPEGNVIRDIVVTTSSSTNLVKTNNTWSDGSFNSTTLTYTPVTNVQSVTFKSANTCQFNTIVVNYGKVIETADKSITYDFTTADATSGKIYGYDVPAASAGVVLTGAVTINPVSITPANAEGATDNSSIRLYTSSGGSTDLRIYQGDALTYAVTGNYHITKIAITTANSSSIDAYSVSSGTLKNGIWTAGDTEVSSVVFTATATTRINTVTVYYAENKTSTGIQSLGTTPRNDDAIYNLAGQRVNQPSKGIYIRNGRKYINR